MFGYFRQLYNRIINQVKKTHKSVSQEVANRYAWIRSNDIVNQAVVSSTPTGGGIIRDFFLKVLFRATGLGISTSYVQTREFDRVNNYLYLASLNVPGVGGSIIVARYHSQDFSFLDFITSSYVSPVSLQQPYYLESNNKYYFMGNSGIVEMTLPDNLQDFQETIISPFTVTGNGGSFMINKIYGHYIYANYSLNDGTGEWLIINKNTGVIEQRTDAETLSLATRGFNDYFDVKTKKLYFIQRRVGDNNLSFRTFDFNTMEETVYGGMPSGVGFGYIFGKVRTIVSETVWEIYGIVGNRLVLDTVDITTSTILKRVGTTESDFPSLAALPSIWFTDKNTPSGITGTVWTLINGDDGRKTSLNIQRVG